MVGRYIVERKRNK